jgi:metal-sulfur cluster biosynthetic enzyme
MSIEETKEKIIENLKQVYDPEISINVYDLGLIYDIKVGEGYCDITMTLTSAFCPAADYIIEDVKGAAMSAGVSLVNVDVVFDPPWGPESMSEDAKLLLDMF